MGQNLQGQVLDGEITQPLGTAKLQEMAKATVAGMMALAIRVATTPAIPGAITNLTGLTHGIMHLNSSRAGVPVLEMEVKAGVMVEMVPDQGPTTTGGSPRKVRAQLAGTVTVTGLGQGVGASQAEPTPTPAATLG